MILYQLKEHFDFIEKFTPSITRVLLNKLNEIIFHSNLQNVNLNEDAIKFMLTTQDIVIEHHKILQNKQIKKFLKIFKSPTTNESVALIATKIPIIENNESIGLLIQLQKFDMPSLQNIFHKYYRFGESSLNTKNLENYILTIREKQCIFFFLLNLNSDLIAQCINNIDSTNLNKNYIDQIFKSQLFPKFQVYNRTHLFHKLIDLGFDRMIPKNVFIDNLSLDVTNYNYIYE